MKQRILSYHMTPVKAPRGGGGALEGGFREGRWGGGVQGGSVGGGGSGRVSGGGGPGEAIWGGGGGGHRLPLPPLALPLG